MIKKTEEKFALRTPGSNLSGLDYSNVTECEKLLIDISKEIYREEGRKQQSKERKALQNNSLTTIESQVPGMRTTSPCTYQSANTLFPMQALEIDLVSTDSPIVSPSPNDGSAFLRPSGARRSAANENLEFVDLIKMLRSNSEDPEEVSRKRALEDRKLDLEEKRIDLELRKNTVDPEDVSRKRALEDRKLDLEEKKIALELRNVEVAEKNAESMLANSNALTLAIQNVLSNAGSKH